MNKLLATLASLFMGAFWFSNKGKDTERAKNAKADRDILKRQRDNDTHSISDSKRMWEKLRNK